MTNDGVRTTSTKYTDTDTKHKKDEHEQGAKGDPVNRAESIEAKG